MKRIVCLILICVLCLNACAFKEENLTWQEQYDLGLRYLSEGNYEEAILAFTAAIEIDPMQADAYVKAAEVYEQMGDIDAAIAILEQGFAAIGDEMLERLLLGLQQQKLPEITEEAQQLFERCFEKMQQEDFRGLVMEGGVGEHSFTQFFYPDHLQYYGLCYDGSGFSTDLSGIGFKLIDAWSWYYGELEKGIPKGQGTCIAQARNMENGLPSYQLFVGEWDNGKPNGAGMRSDVHCNGSDDQTLHTLEGNWDNGLLNGDVVDQFYTSGQLQYEHQYTCSQGKYALDERWEQNWDGKYHLPSVFSVTETIYKSYQTDLVWEFLSGLEAAEPSAAIAEEIRRYTAEQPETEQTPPEHTEEHETTQSVTETEPEETLESSQAEMPVGENAIFDETYWTMMFGVSMGGYYISLFHADGTFTAMHVNTQQFSDGTYTYEDGVLYLSFPESDVWDEAYVQNENGGFSSMEEHVAQVTAMVSYSIDPAGAPQAELFREYYER